MTSPRVCLVVLSLLLLLTASLSAGTADLALALDVPPADAIGPTIFQTLDAAVYRVFTIANINDSGDGSLRATIEAANAQCDVSIPCKLVFAPSGTIFLQSPLPLITASDVLIDGEERLVLDGTSAGAGDGLRFYSSFLTVRNLTIRNFVQNGISVISRPTQSVIENNIIEHNGERGIGAIIFSGHIHGNAINGNGRSGIYIEAARTAAITGNHIGDVTPNGASGIYIGALSGGVSIDDNVIADNQEFGVALARPNNVAVGGNTIRGNGGDGIDVGLDGPSASDPGPRVMSARFDATTGETIIEGTGTPRSGWVSVTAYVYANEKDVAQGEHFLGSATVGPDGRFTMRVNEDSRGKFLTASGQVRENFDNAIFTRTTEFTPRVRVE